MAKMLKFAALATATLVSARGQVYVIRKGDEVQIDERDAEWAERRSDALKPSNKEARDALPGANRTFAGKVEGKGDGTGDPITDPKDATDARVAGLNQLSEAEGSAQKAVVVGPESSYTTNFGVGKGPNMDTATLDTEAPDSAAAEGVTEGSTSGGGSADDNTDDKDDSKSKPSTSRSAKK